MFSKFFVFDFKNGIIRSWKKYLIAALFFSFCGIVAYFTVLNSTASNADVDAVTMTVGDFILYPFVGMEKFVYEKGTPFMFPALWLFTVLFIAFITLYYPYHDLNGIGRQMLILSGNRSLWWYSKCIWAAVSVCIYFFLGYFVSFLCALCCKADLSLRVNNIVTFFYGFNVREMEQEQLFSLSEWNMGSFMATIPLCVLAICLLQMFLSLAIKPMFSFLTTAVILFASAYFQSPFLIGNYAMVARSRFAVSDGVDIWMGVLLSVLIILMVTLLGRQYFKNMDIF